jgi:choline dehydrogenase-like flavoprotein
VTHDVLVLGGGTAGCVLAARLSEDPSRSVCLVEAGPDYGPYVDGRWPEDMLDGRTLAFSHAWERQDEDDRSQLRARIIGGCSAHNACALLPGLPADYDEWGHGWSHAVMAPYLARAARQLRGREFADEEVSPWQKAFTTAGRTIGLAGGPHPANAVGSVRWHTGFAYLDEARDRDNLTVLADTLAERVLLADGRTTGAETSSGPVEAKLVVVASGSYGSPALLLRSGIGPGLHVDLPVGENLRDHVGVGYSWEVDERLVRETEEFEREHPLFMGQVTLFDEPRDLFVFPSNVHEEAGGYEFTGAVFSMKPYSTGRVRLSSDDPAAPPVVEHGFLADQRDVATLVRGIEVIRRLASTEPLAGYLGPEERPGPDADLETYVRTEVRGFFHPVGTCALGSVVDGRARVLGVENLVVADASIMPTIPRSNTNLSTVAIAERVAELV